MDNIHQRARVGVDDFVLLENHRDPEEFLNNLKKRFQNDIIYTYIGQVLVSVNPYKPLPIYNSDYSKEYNNVNFYHAPPHIFAIADASFRTMVEECRDQCILIAGESGAGKTESSKQILQYLSEITVQNHEQIQKIKDRLLYSNPILEAFGNAKTSRNNNSSRFGKYMDIQFDYLGSPIGGNINVYLLEKSRVVCAQSKCEQNFHIFYMLLKSADDDLLQRLHLRRDPQHYFYLNQNVCDLDDMVHEPETDHFKVICEAFNVFGFSASEQANIFGIVAAILHLGNVGFFEEDNGKTVIANMKPVTHVSQLLECDQSALKDALLNRTIEAGSERMATDLTRDHAIYARDALAKAIYQRLFVWLVGRLNDSLREDSKTYRNGAGGGKTLMGLLDIYGFEIFDQNNFEQFCINYCNEKLQQIFIELTLKQEQEEYRREQIEWEPVPYFNNRTICDLIEAKHNSIIAYLDEECLRPGDTNDASLLTKLNDRFSDHPHYFPVIELGAKYRQNGIMPAKPMQFKITHYAGEVVYNINGFIDKNNDLLFRDLKKAMASSENEIIGQLFSPEELSNIKRPATTATQFRQSLANLMELLASKQPWYIRCIKPNDFKQPNRFDDQIVKHQVQYLGLMENLRIRRAGFAYRRNYNDFLERYKCLCPDTWPYYRGSFRDGVQTLIDHFGYNTDEYKMGITKIFIRSPETLFRIEDAFQRHKHVLAAKLQALWRGYRQRKRYLKMRQAAIRLQALARRQLAMKKMLQRKWAAAVIRNFIKGFITRLEEPNPYNRQFLLQVKTDWLNKLAKNLPRALLDNSWPSEPGVCREVRSKSQELWPQVFGIYQASEQLRKMHKKWMARKYVLGLNPQRKEILQEKVLAECLFKNKKRSYPGSVGEAFESNRLDAKTDELRKTVFEVKHRGDNEKTKYCAHVNKYDRHGYTARSRVVIVTNQNFYLLDSKMNVKEIVPLNSIKVVTSGRDDGLFILKKEITQKKGDLILEFYPRTIEMLTKLMKYAGQDKLIVTDDQIIEHHMADGKSGRIQFVEGFRYEITKSKDGILQVSSVSP